LCDRAIILINGQIKTDAQLSELAATSDAILVLERAPAGVDRALRGLSGVRAVQPVRLTEGYPAYHVQGQPGEAVDLCPVLFNLAREEGWPVRELRRDIRTLETVFNELATAA
jgi:hypothetical protein